MSSKGRDTFPRSGDRSSTGAGSDTRSYGKSLGDEIKGLLHWEDIKSALSRPQGPRIPPESTSEKRYHDAPSGSGRRYPGRRAPGPQPRSSGDGYVPQKHAFSALKPSGIQTQEYDSHGYRVQSSKIATSSLDVNVDPGIQSQRRHDGYSEPESESEDEGGDRVHNGSTPGRLNASVNAEKPPTSIKERTLHQDTALWHRAQSGASRPSEGWRTQRKRYSSSGTEHRNGTTSNGGDGSSWGVFGGDGENGGGVC